MTDTTDHGPVDQRFVTVLNALARGIDDVLNGEDCPPEKKTMGFLLCIYEFGEPHPGSRFNYISNSDRTDVMATLRDILSRNEPPQPEQSDKALDLLKSITAPHSAEAGPGHER